MKMKNDYFLLRHGQTSYQAKRKATLYSFPEKKPINLTEKGKKQILESAKKLKKRNSLEIDLVFSSDILRTKQTAAIAGRVLGKKPVFDARLREVNFGDFHGKTKKSYYGYFSSLKQRFTKRPPNGESLNDVVKRLKIFLKEIEKKYRGKRILIISHGDTLRLLMGIIKGIDLNKVFKKYYFETGELKKIKKN